MKKFLSLLLCVLLVCIVFSGCENSSSQTDSPAETSSQAGTSSQMSSSEEDFTWEENTDKLVVCFDVGTSFETDGVGRMQAISGFQQLLTTYHDRNDLPIRASDVELLVIPGGEVEPAERSAMLQKVRTDIMAGKGPDVFINVSYNRYPFDMNSISGGRLFNFPEITRESGLFLPLDDLLSKFTLTNIDDLHPQVLEGGRNQNGELVMIPLVFSVPGVFFPGADAPECEYQGTSWEDVIEGSDPLLAEQANWTLNFWRFSEDGTHVGDHNSGLPYLFPEIANTETGKLAFSEEELLSIIQDSFAAYRQVLDSETAVKSGSNFFYVSPLSGGSDAWEFEGVPHDEKGLYTLSPLRNLSGGSTAVVSSYCAVNANTEKKEQAVALLDALLCTDHQSGGLATLFGQCLGFGGMPIDKTIGAADCPYVDSSGYLLPEQFELWQEVCEDINVVRFSSPLDVEFDNMMMEIEDAMGVYYHPTVEDLIQRDGRFLSGSITDEKLAEIVSKYYRRMQTLIDEA